MKSHTMIVKILSEHILMVILHFLVKKCGFWTKIVSSLETSGLLQKQ